MLGYLRVSVSSLQTRGGAPPPAHLPDLISCCSLTNTDYPEGFGWFRVCSLHTLCCFKSWPLLNSIVLSAAFFFFVSFPAACVRAKLLQSRLTSAILWTVACHTSLSMGFSRQEYWSGLPGHPPGDLPNPRIEPVSRGQKKEAKL